MRRRLAMQLLVGVLSVVAATVGTSAWASAKGPLPTIGEPAEPMVAGETSVVPISTEWPDGAAPIGSQYVDMWGDDLPWTLVVVPADVAVSQGEAIPVRHVGPDRYTAEFIPPSEGEWRLVFVTPDHTGTYYELAVGLSDRANPMSRTFAVEPPPSGTSAWPVLLASALLVGIAVVTLLVVSRWRAGRQPAPNRLAPTA